MRDVEIKRIYDEPARGDGHRVLVDRLWPRGITKERAHLDEWAKVFWLHQGDDEVAAL